MTARKGHWAQKQAGAAYLEYALVVSLIAMSCLGAIEVFATEGIQGAFCQVLSGEPDLDTLINDGRFDPETGECRQVANSLAWEFDEWL